MKTATKKSSTVASAPWELTQASDRASSRRILNRQQTESGSDFEEGSAAASAPWRVSSSSDDDASPRILGRQQTESGSDFENVAPVLQ